MFIASAPGVNFINILRTAFTLADPESVKRYLWLSCILYINNSYIFDFGCNDINPYKNYRSLDKVRLKFNQKFVKI
jgi:mRNA-degrading endonuclease HigB of HigAB toxin-antitoxin module